MERLAANSKQVKPVSAQILEVLDDQAGKEAVASLAKTWQDLTPQQKAYADYQEKNGVQRTRFGHLLESFVLQQLIAMGGWMEEAPRFCHYRDKDQVEVDLVLESGNRVWGVEVKAVASATRADGKGVLRLADVAGDRFQGGIILYDGDETVPIHREQRIFAVPISRLWEA